jgi:hypothetical protein
MTLITSSQGRAMTAHAPNLPHRSRLLWGSRAMSPSLTRLLRLALCFFALSLTALTPPAARAATLTVTSLADSGAGSLRAAVAAAAAGDTITFAPGVTDIVLTSGQITIVQPITIDGPGVTVDGNHSSRVFYVNGGSAAQPVALTGLIIRNGYSGGDVGGGILMEKNTALSMTSCALIANATAGTADAGGLFSNNNTTVTMTGCTVTGNSAYGDGGAGVECFGNTLLTDDIVYNNAGGDASLYNGYTVSHCDIGGYAATPDANGNFGADPQFVSAADLHLQSTSPCIGKGVTVPGATFDIMGVPRFAPPSIGAYEYVNQNFVVTNTNDSGSGSLRDAIGAADAAPHSLITFDPNVFAAPQTITLTTGQLNVTASTAILAPAIGVAVDGNNASRVFEVAAGGLSAVGVTIQNGRDDGGGGVLIDFGASLSLTGCTLTGNSANDGGGGLDNRGDNMTLTSCTVTGNTTGNYGGGLYNGGNMTVTSCTVTGNSASSGGGGLVNVFGNVTVTDAIIYNNEGSDTEFYGGSVPISHCDIGGYPATPDANGNFGADPLFVRAPSAIGSGDYGDLHLQPGSPVIGMGTTDAGAYLPYDLDGVTRANPPSIGAYEFVAANTTTSLVSNPNPSAYGQNVTFTATVSNTDSGLVPTGSVTFTVDGAPGSPIALDGSGHATLTTSSLSVGPHTVSVAFNGSARFAAGSSGPLAQTVNPDATSTTLGVGPGVPLHGFGGDTPPLAGERVSLHAEVSDTDDGALTAGGAVQFYVAVGGGPATAIGGPVPLQSPLSGTTAFTNGTYIIPASGTYTFTAVYVPDSTGDFAPSTGGPVPDTALADPTALTLISSAPNGALYGQPVTFTANLTSGSLPLVGQSVTFRIDGGTGQTVPTDVNGNASLVTPQLPAGPHTVTASYADTTNPPVYAPSSAGVTQTVSADATSTTLAGGGTTVTPGTSVTFAANVTDTSVPGITPTGSVQLIVNGQPIGTPVPLTNGAAALTYAFPAPGIYSVAAAYTPAPANFSVSDSRGNPLTETVLSALASVSVAPSSVTGGYGVTGTVTLSAPAAVATVVSLQSGSASATVPATVTVPAGKTSATFPVTTKGVNVNTAVTLTATLSGVSKAATLSLTPAPCMIGFTVSPNTVVGGATATGTITLSAPAAPGGYSVCLFGLPGLPGLPSTVTVPQGQTTLDFPIVTPTVNCLYATLIFAFSPDSIGLSYLIVTPVPKVAELDLPGSVKGGQSTTGVVTLNTIASTPITVSLSATGPVSVPATVTIPAGSSCASFPVTTSAVSKTTGATVTASCNGSSQSDTISVTR